MSKETPPDKTLTEVLARILDPARDARWALAVRDFELACEANDREQINAAAFRLVALAREPL